MISDQFLNPVLNPEPVGDWLIFILTGVLSAYVVVRLLFPKYWYRYRQALFYPIEASKLLEEKNTNQLQASFFLNILATISVSSFICIAAALLGIGLNQISPGSFLLFNGIGVFLTLLKYSGTRLLGFLFQSTEISSDYNHIWLIHFKITGLAILFCAILTLFVPSGLKEVTLILGFVILVMMLIINMIRGLAILFQNKVSIFYGILYLCTLEILPILVISRLIIA